MENSIKRNLRYVLYVQGKNILMILGVTALFLSLNLLYGQDMKSSILEGLGFMGFYVSVFGMFCFNARMSMLDMKIIFSFCSRRRDYFIAKLVVNIVSIIGFTLLDIGIAELTGNSNVKMMLFFPAVLCIITALSTICSIVIMVFGKKGYMVFVIIVCGLFGGLLPTVMDSNFVNIFRNLNISFFSAITVFTVLIMMCACVVEWKMIKNYEVRV